MLPTPSQPPPTCIHREMHLVAEWRTERRVCVQSSCQPTLRVGWVGRCLACRQKQSFSVEERQARKSAWTESRWALFWKLKSREDGWQGMLTSPLAPWLPAAAAAPSSPLSPSLSRFPQWNCITSEPGQKALRSAFASCFEWRWLAAPTATAGSVSARAPGHGRLHTVMEPAYLSLP